MNTWGLSGFSGTVGQALQDTRSFNYLYNSKNINDIVQDKVDIIICAAPTGNRLWVANNTQDDINNINFLIQILKQTTIKKFILISTVDSLTATTSYGKNRKQFETKVKNIFNDYHIVRLSSLISSHIKKNVLFDLKNKVFLESINLESETQWCLLNILNQEINDMINFNIKEKNLVSEPIKHRYIIDLLNISDKEQIGTSPLPVQKYNVIPAIYTKEIILENMREYLK